MKPWVDRPGEKVAVLRFDLECMADHMSDPAKWGSMLKEQARIIRLQLEAHDRMAQRRRTSSSG